MSSSINYFVIYYGTSQEDEKSETVFITQQIVFCVLISAGTPYGFSVMHLVVDVLLGVAPYILVISRNVSYFIPSSITTSLLYIWKCYMFRPCLQAIMRQCNT